MTCFELLGKLEKRIEMSGYATAIRKRPSSCFYSYLPVPYRQGGGHDRREPPKCRVAATQTQAGVKRSGNPRTANKCKQSRVAATRPLDDEGYVVTQGASRQLDILLGWRLRRLSLLREAKLSASCRYNFLRVWLHDGCFFVYNSRTYSWVFITSEKKERRFCG